MCETSSAIREEESHNISRTSSYIALLSSSYEVPVTVVKSQMSDAAKKRPLAIRSAYEMGQVASHQKPKPTTIKIAKISAITVVSMWRGATQVYIRRTLLH